ncbi:MAG: hypothetical protein M0Z59_07270 [Nitrospiraceae bacterium]|nr:hypothetical protein [Nitrospiraceae bacterium]
MMKKLALLFFLLLLPRISQAFELSTVKPQPPFGVFSTFSTQSLRQGDVSFGINIERTQSPDFYRHTLGFAYGVTNRAEITLNLPYVDGFEGESGFEDLGAAFKYRFIDQGRYGPSAAILVTGYAPTGRDEFSRNGGVGGGLALGRKLGPLMANLNAIITKPGKSSLKNEFDLLAGLEFAATHNIRALGEFQLRKEAFSSKVDLSELRFGLRYIGDSFYNTIGVGFNLKNGDPQFRVIFQIGAILERNYGRF